MTLPFADLTAGGQELADALAARDAGPNPLVLGIVRGGVPAAGAVARRLDLPLDLLLSTALVGRSSGQLLRAASVAGTLVLDDGCQSASAGSVERLVVDDGVRALTTRTTTCRGARPAIGIDGRTVLLVDNGMRTGQTMAAAIRAVRTLRPGRIMAAAPAATPAAVALVSALADRCLCLVTSASLGNVAMAYRRFEIPGEARIRELLERG